jgi:hypothetical protein
LIAELLAEQDADASGWYWQLDEIPDTDESRYLYELMASHRFQEALKSYRDLLYLNENLDHWAESLGAFDDILDTKQRAFQSRLPVVEASLNRMDLDAMAGQRVKLESQLLEVERNENAVALGTREQQQLWAELTALEPKLAQLGDADPRAEDFRSKQRFLKGLLDWELKRDYRARLWSVQRNLQDLDRQLKIARGSHFEVATAADDWPEQFDGLTARIGMLRPRVAQLRETAQITLGRQQAYLQEIAIETLELQRDRLNTYMVQARFSLASIYDRATARVDIATDQVVAEDRP